MPAGAAQCAGCAAMAETGALRLVDVTRVVGGETWLGDVELELVPGEITVLLGPTLAGKTSLMRVVAGLDRPTRGRVEIGGVDVTGRPVRERDVAFVYQQFINYPSFTVYNNIAAPLHRSGVARAELDRRVREVAGLLHIDGLLQRLPAELSGGQQQRTAIARALVKEAGLVLLDEPLVNLDYKLREELREELKQIFAARSAMLVYATTEPLEALLLGGKTVVLHEGRVLQSGPTLEVFHRPVDVRVGQVFSDPPMNVLPGRIAAGTVHIGDAHAPAADHLAGLAPGDYRFGIRCNHLRQGAGSAGQLALRGEVQLSEINGSETFVHVALPGGHAVAHLDGVHPAPAGQPFELHVGPDRLFAFDGAGRLAAAPPAAGTARASAA